MKLRGATALVCLLASIQVSPAFAEDNGEVRRLREELESTRRVVIELEQRLEKLEARERTEAVAEDTIQADEGRPVPPTPRRRSQALNPEIGVVADITYFGSESDEDAEGNDKLSVRELELIIGADIDPYTRFDATLTYSDFEDFEIEEAYISHFGLPGGLQVRAGRVRPAIGKVNALHLDQQDASDFPLAVQEYLGVDGWFRSGLELSALFSLGSGNWVHEVTVGAYEGGTGEGGTMFGDTRRRPTMLAHLKNFWEVSDDTSLELGAGWLQGSSGEDEDLDVLSLVGDATFTHRFSPLYRLKLQSEVWWQDRDYPFVGVEEDGHGLSEAPAAFRSNPLGLYVLGDLRFSGRWGAGLRFDYVEPVNIEGAGDQDVAETAYLSFYQSEYFRLRLQYQHVDLAEGGDDNRVWLQSTAAIGIHKHALQ